MSSFLRDWRPSRLFAAWGAYWAVLAAVFLPAPLLAMWRAYRTPDGVHGSIAGGMTLEHVSLTVTIDGATTYAATVPHAVLAGVLLGPPLLLALAWAVRVRRPGSPDAAPDALGAGMADHAPPARHAEPITRTRQ